MKLKEICPFRIGFILFRKLNSRRLFETEIDL